MPSETPFLKMTLYGSSDKSVLFSDFIASLCGESTNSALSKIDSAMQTVSSNASKAYKYVGSVATYDDLPTAASTGDVYDVASDHSNWAWNGESWDSLGPTIDLSGYATQQWVTEQFASATSSLPKTTTISVAASATTASYAFSFDVGEYDVITVSPASGSESAYAAAGVTATMSGNTLILTVATAQSSAFSVNIAYQKGVSL